MSEKKARRVSKPVARTPVQERSAARMQKVVAVAEQLLEQLGPESTSIPAIAAESAVPRAAIYPFFPDKYALFSHIARLHMERLVQTLQATEPDPASAADWRGQVGALVAAAVDYYNGNPVASILLLRGALADGDVEAHRAKDAAISQLLRERVDPEARLPQSPDVAVLAVDIAFACMRHGYAVEGVISPVYAQEASNAACAYLASWLPR
ncbi:MAG: TetR/AcrR family transcriptional regulator [Pseudomonadaceae bacterium]